MMELEDKEHKTQGRSITFFSSLPCCSDSGEGGACLYIIWPVGQEDDSKQDNDIIIFHVFQEIASMRINLCTKLQLN